MRARLGVILRTSEMAGRRPAALGLDVFETKSARLQDAEARGALLQVLRQKEADNQKKRQQDDGTTCGPGDYIEGFGVAVGPHQIFPVAEP